MNTKKHIFLLLFFVPISLLAQFQLNGVVLDKSKKEPVPFATIYLNGTTIGTITNIHGEFTLKNAISPSLLVISHISYHSLTLPIDSVNQSLPTLHLEKRNINLVEVNINDRNMRSINLEIFRNWLLGTDKFGKNAQIKNDSVLFFYSKYADNSVDLSPKDDDLDMNRAITNKKKSKKRKLKLRTHLDSLVYFSGQLESLKVVAKAPLQIEMPLLGEKLQYDMVDFLLNVQNKKQQSCRMLGYFYFEFLTTKNPFKKSAYKYKRKAAYLHSIQHFCRSLYHNTLPQNGYRLSVYNKELKMYEEINSDSILSTTLNGERLIQGRKDQFIKISYLCDYQSRPVDWTNDQFGYIVKNSGFHLLSDTCIIRSDGSIPNNKSLSFTGEISKKRLGSFLPFDYNPFD